jgi:holin-like protein
MIHALLIILACQLAGEVTSRSLGLPVPGPVLGMMLLTLGLALSPWLMAQVRPVAQGILSHLSLLFIPAGVGVVGHLSAIAGQGWALAAAIVASTVLAIAVGALVFAAVARMMGASND